MSDTYAARDTDPVDTSTDAISRMLNALVERLTAKHAERAHLALEYAVSGDKAAFEVLSTADDEIAVTKERIELYQALLLAWQKRDGVVNEFVNRRIQVAALIDQHLEALGTLLALWGDTCKQCKREVDQALHVAYASGDLAALADKAGPVAAACSAEAISQALGDALQQSGLTVGTVSLTQSMGLNRERISCTQAAAVSGEELMARLGEVLLGLAES